MVLAHWSSNRLRHIRICLPHDTPILPVSSQLGPVDLRIRSLFHSHFQRFAVLLRHVLFVQRRRQTIRRLAGVLEVLVRVPQM